MMSTTYLIVSLSALTALTSLVLIWVHRRNKEATTQLRLLNGRRHLIDEEIARQSAALQAVDAKRVATLQQRAEEALDGLNVALVERQAHLLNYADLAHLQAYKIDLYREEIAASETLSPATKEGSPRPPAAKDEPPPQSIQNNRGQIENQLLDKINRLNAGKKR